MGLLLLSGIRVVLYTQCEGHNLANQKSRKLGVFGRKWEGRHSQLYHYLDKY